MVLLLFSLIGLLACLAVWLAFRPPAGKAKGDVIPEDTPKEVVSHAPATPAAAASRSAVTAAEPQDPDAYWVAPGKRVQIHGYELPDGLFYAGTGLHRVSGHGVEPSLIDPKLRVTTGGRFPSQEELPYLPSYRELSTTQRAEYLRWLAGGRCDSRIDPAYVFLFLYGLERRVLSDTQRSAEARKDLPRICSELDRLLFAYGRYDSFRHYAGNLLRAAQLLLHGGNFCNLDPPHGVENGELPVALRIGLAQMAASGKPLPAAWALAWLESDPEYPLPRTAVRSAEEFRQLFALRYLERHGEGIVLPAGEEPLQCFFRPCSPSFRGEVNLAPAHLTDVTGCAKTTSMLRELAASCLNDIAAYSRYQSRYPLAENSFRGLARLPRELLRHRNSPKLAALRAWLAELVESEPLAVADWSELFRHLSDTRPGALTMADMVQMSTFLGKLNYGIEPDPHRGAFLLNCGSKFVLFRLPEDEPELPSNRFLAVATVLHLSAIATGGEQIRVMEKRQLQDELAYALRIGAAESLRLQAVRRWVMILQPVLGQMKNALGCLEFEPRRVLARLVRQISECCWTGLSEAAMEALNQIHLALRFDDLPQWEEATRRKPAHPEESGREPDNPAGADTQRVESLLVSALQAATALRRFLDPGGVSGLAPAEADVGSLPGLDHRAMLAVFHLLKRPSWPRIDFDKLVEPMANDSDEAIELINEGAMARYGEPLLLGDDPIQVNAGLMKKMLN